MSENLNKTIEKRSVNKRTFAWIGIEDNPNNDSVYNQNIETIESNSTKSYGLGWIPFEDSGDENIPEPRKRAKEGLIFIPFGQNSANVLSEEIPKHFEFSVPQKIPPKLKKKLTPSKITPARRPTQGSSSSLRRATFRVTPRSVTYLGGWNRCNLEMTRGAITTIKKRRSSGLMRTPKNKISVIDLNTPSSSAKCFVGSGVEEIQYMSWINMMLAPKGDDKSDKIDSNQLIIECFNSTKVCLSECPTKERMSVKAYQESVKWNQLRTSAKTLYRSDQVQKINRKIMSYIENNKFAIRKDRAVHADTGIRKHILELLLSYNPLWLRIGLETVFNQKIEMTSNGIKSSLGQFIAQNLLVAKELMAKYGHKTNTHFFKDDNHINEAKKHILTKFLLLLNWLDYAKQKRLIQHNPCLFRISGQFKSTLDVIISFARDYITGVGDITKYLAKYTGFSISYKQTPIEEFDFEANNLAIDLRCGIRLTRLAELMTDSSDLLSKLLYPANNITRKLHNVETALKAFGDVVPKGITSKDIVSGHRKKTFELLDSIIFKYKTDMILIEDKMREQCVVSIQRLFRANRMMRIERQKFEKLKYFAILLQKRFRDNKLQRIERRERMRIQKSVLFVQRKFRANRVMRIERKNYQQLRCSSVWAQRLFRANQLMRTERQRFERLKQNTVWIQRRFRANKAMERQKQEFERLKSYTILVQRVFRANRLMKTERQRFEDLKYWSLWVQRKFRNNRLMRAERQRFETLKRITVWTQRRLRANKAMERQKQDFEQLKSSTVWVQRLFRANYLMKIERQKFEKLKYYSLSIQRKFRANREMRAERERFDRLKQFTVWTQRRFRANKAMERQKQDFEQLKSSTVWVQRLFRANRLMRIERQEFKKIKYFTIILQKRFREKMERMRLKRAVLLVQRKFRANRVMRIELKNYQQLRCSSVWAQRLFRANKLMRTERQRFERLKQNTVWTQRRFRANKAMEKQKQEFERLKSYTILVQRMFRANRLMKTERQRFEDLKYWSLWVQRKFRNNRLMRAERQRFETLKRITVWTQRRLRANKAIEREKLKSIVLIQRRFRANRLMRTERQQFESLKVYTVFIQRKFRQRLVELRTRSAAIKIQSLWRGYRTRKCIHEENKKVEIAFRRILTSTSLATEDMLLGNRTFNALQKLLGYNSLLSLAKDLDSLNKTTELSADSCETIATYGAVDILLQIMNESNRSEPHKQIVVLSICILLNLAKFETTLPKLVSNSETVETLFKMIRMFSRDNTIICKSFTLLWILLQNPTIFTNVISNKRKMDSIKQISDHLKMDKSFRKRKPKTNYKFWPKWQIAKTNAYQFDNHLIAIQAISHRLKID